MEELKTLLTDMHNLMLDVMPWTYKDGRVGHLIFERYNAIMTQTDNIKQESEQEHGELTAAE
jgi:hypothetical protein